MQSSREWPPASFIQLPDCPILLSNVSGILNLGFHSGQYPMA